MSDKNGQKNGCDFCDFIEACWDAFAALELKEKSGFYWNYIYSYAKMYCDFWSPPNDEAVKNIFQNSNKTGKDDPVTKFFEKYFRQKVNGVASVGQVYLTHDIYSEMNNNLTKILDDINKNKYVDAFNKIDAARKKGEVNTGKKLNFPYAHLNRIFANAHPDRYCNISSNSKLVALYKYLKKEKIFSDDLSKAKFDSEQWAENSKDLHKKVFDCLEKIDPLKKISEIYKKNLKAANEKIKKFQWPSCEKLNDEIKEHIIINVFIWFLVEFLTNDSTDKLNTKQVVYYGSPGTGKTFLAKKRAKYKVAKFFIEKECKFYKDGLDNHIETVQFHPSYTYEDFIEGIKPEIYKNSIIYTLKNGKFKDFCKEAAIKELEWAKKNNQASTDQKAEPFIFIIDEINRADLSRVFGELMFCLEYRGTEGQIQTQYHGMKSTSGVFQNGFYIPENVYIIGTMNVIDRSVEAFDFALRRRFGWERFDPDMEPLEYLLVSRGSNDKDMSDLKKRIEDLNKKIEKDSLLGKDYQIGQSYFMKIADYLEDTKKMENAKNQLWENHLSPLLEEYLRGMGSDNRLKQYKEIFIPSQSK